MPATEDPLSPLLAPMLSLRGVGPERTALLARVAGGERVVDLLLHLPESYLDRSARPSLRAAEPGALVTLDVVVERTEAPSRPGRPWRVVVGDGTGWADLVFFRPLGIERFRPGERLLVSGKVDRYGGRLRMSHPDYVVPAGRPEGIPTVEPVWRLTEGLRPGQVAAVMRRALTCLHDLPEWGDPPLVAREKWPGFAAAVRCLQAPTTMPEARARTRLAYDELFANQVALGLARGRARVLPGRSLAGDGRLRAVALARFGHAPTESQRAAIAAIDADMEAPRRMLRLLQGDVGSGKTLVALMAMLRAAEAGAQAALMAPTEVLARQHHRTLSRLSPVPVELLTGSVVGRPRAVALRRIEDGAVRLVVGTHTLFQEGVAYADLGLAVIDEQHRFGVEQRMMLGEKGERTDVLVMTATPIPRTLVLTNWAELDVSRLTGKPAGRQPIRTTLHGMAALDEVIAAVARKLDADGRVYWVCPLVTESEALDLAAAEARYAALRERFGARVVLAHGRQTQDQREASLAAFASGAARLLVATTVIEVGIDVPEASVMVIEHAERFGLAQLHQLRGRVGRGAEASFCLMLHDDRLTEPARRRLTVLRDTEDGFVIADEDFRARGGGDVMGKRQSGLPSFRIADPIEDERLLRIASRDAASLLARDPALTSARGGAVRDLLRIFDRDPRAWHAAGG